MGMYRHRMPDREIQMAKDWTQEKLIDTLEKECEQLRGWYIVKIDQNAELQTQIESCSAEIERLREDKEMWADATAKAQQEIERLREALKKIAERSLFKTEEGSSTLLELAKCLLDMEEIARSALKGDE
jgi:cell division septum initiation protein DivIVA